MPAPKNPKARPSPPPVESSARSLVIGVLGGIASGKSAAARLLSADDGVVIDADRIAHEVLDSAAVRDELARAFGASVLGADGRPDRQALARRVFGSPSDKHTLESFTHPPIRARIRAAIDEARRRNVRRIVLDVPLLLENERQHGLVELCDVLVFVDAPLEVREARASAARAWPAGEVARREAAQLALSAKRARADYVIENRTSLADFEHAVERVSAAIDER
jgi:dephospho-CoA kinase